MTMRSKYAWLVVLGVLAAIMLVPGVAWANFGVHGNYTMNTDACAGCHRTHTAVSSITWEAAPGDDRSALLLSTATELWQFCYVCHDAAGQGADTNVQEGVYEGTLYGTQGAILNSGGFESLGPTATTSTHMYTGASWGAYGGGLYAQGSVGATGNAIGQVGTGNLIKMSCGSCHDPHGSSNYRILRDYVNGNRVGGYYDASYDPTPTPFVKSTEVGYPSAGFRLHTAYPAYVPNYTRPMYAKGETDTVYMPGVPGDVKGMSGWCVGCHSTYLDTSSLYNANDRYGLLTRYRHAMNVDLQNYLGPRALIITDLPLPLAHDMSEVGTPVNRDTDWIECLTCHRAHGTAAVMTGYANVADSTDPLPDSGSGGVEPAGDSALLRGDNRYVCEVCHNK